MFFFLILGEVKTSNARFSTASSIEGDDQLQLDQLVVAQVHHDPIHEKRVEEEQELKGKRKKKFRQKFSIIDDVFNFTLGNNELDKKIDVDELKEQIHEDSTQNTESYSFAGE